MVELATTQSIWVTIIPFDPDEAKRLACKTGLEAVNGTGT